MQGSLFQHQSSGTTLSKVIQLICKLCAGSKLYDMISYPDQTERTSTFSFGYQNGYLLM